MSKSLVIVESPAKARTIGKFLGADFVVESSIGHVRDLPQNAAQVPAAYKKESWARLGVDVDNDFKPLYVINADKKAQITKLKGLLKEADRVFLATDEDREGESIAWHLLEVLNPRVPVQRMVFHEITKEAIDRALAAPRELDRRLVDAQEARRILDRLYGYEVSPVLWRKVLPRLSAGRVQSVATRIVVARERERIAFRSAGWWDIESQFRKAGDAQAFGATLAAIAGKRVATGKDFDPKGQLKADVVRVGAEDAAALASSLQDTAFAVRTVEEKPYSRKPSPPFITSTLQQEAGRKLRFSSARTMQIAQRLYENGFITYMRTDSTTLSEQAVSAARDQARRLYGAEYVPAEPRSYQRKVKNAQEAHEAIRPAGDSFRTPDQVGGSLNADELRLYELIWMRTIASQMNDARGMSLQVRLGGVAGDGRDVEFATSGRTISFPGFLRAYVEGSDDPDAALEDREVRLPQLAVGDRVDALSHDPKEHATQPPARYTEASLVKALEDLGVGRPSTYAQVISTILDRGYVWKKGTALVPSFTAFAVVGLLEQHFGDLVDYEFTARMEDDLDRIAGGQQDSIPWLRQFYFGDETPGLRAKVSDQLDAIDPREVNSIQLGADENGEVVMARVGRYGPYVARGEDTASIPEDMAPDELTVERALELLSAPSQERTLGVDPVSGLTVRALPGRFGPYVQLGETEGKNKAKTASLFASMDLATLSLEDALQLLSLPRLIGQVDGVDVYARNGRFGPYIDRDGDSRSLESEDALFAVTLEQAAALLAEPKQRRARGPAKPPLAEFGPDPVSGKPIVLKEGRFGPYVTDGETNASLPRGEEIAELTASRAAELIQERRDKGPVVKKTRARAAAPRKTTARTVKKGAGRAKA